MAKDPSKARTTNQNKKDEQSTNDVRRGERIRKQTTKAKMAVKSGEKVCYDAIDLTKLFNLNKQINLFTSSSTAT